MMIGVLQVVNNTIWKFKFIFFLIMFYSYKICPLNFPAMPQNSCCLHWMHDMAQVSWTKTVRSSHNNIRGLLVNEREKKKKGRKYNSNSPSPQVVFIYDVSISILLSFAKSNAIVSVCLFPCCPLVNQFQRYWNFSCFVASMELWKTPKS